jgi:tetratricopeptide (TPR) repeat protein
MPCRLALLAVLVGVTTAAAAPPLDTQAKDAYRWRVVVRTGRHPVFGPAFREQLGREVRASLQGAVGPAAAVEVIDLAAVPPDSWEPLWKEFAATGWTALDPNPRDGRELTGVKTHLLTVDYRDGQFVLESRQADGSTGLATPFVRRQAVRAADMVGRLAALMLEPDFGPTGTVDPAVDTGGFVRVTFRGHSIAPPDRVTKIGDIYAVGVVTEVRAKAGSGLPNRLVAKPRDVTLLKLVEPARDGVAKFQVLSGAKFPFGLPQGIAGVRCMKLPTVESKVRLKVVNTDGSPHPRGSLVQVAATDTDFNAKPGQQESFEFRDGLYKSGKPFNNVACVQVAIGAAAPRLFPIPVYSDEPVVIQFAVKPEDELRAAFERRCMDLRGKIADTGQAQTALYTELGRLIDTGQFREAFNRAEGGAKQFTASEQQLTQELKGMREEPQSQLETAKAILDVCDTRLVVIREALGRLTKSQEELRKTVEKNKDPIKVEREFREKELANRIQELVQRGDIPEALEAYDKLIILQPANQPLKDQREKLQTEWAPKDDAHRIARKSMKQWTDARTQEDFKEALAELKKSVPILVAKQDRLGLRKMLNVFEPGYVTLNVLVTALDTRTEDGAKAAKELEEIVNDSRRTEAEVRELLKQLLADKK